MNESYPAKYRDEHGEEITRIQNDGKLLSLTVRGVAFLGDDFDSLETSIPLNSPQLKSFTLPERSLADCEIECDMPITAVFNQKETLCNLHIHLTLGKPRANGGIDNEDLQLRLDFDGESITSCGKHGWFDDELLEIQKSMPEQAYLKCCHNCAFSDYHPTGSGLFGSMACFRDSKEQYLKVKSKSDLFHIWETMRTWVQETDLCSEFKRREIGTGYRG